MKTDAVKMVVATGTHTYMRAAMPDGMRATCSLCCRPIKVGAAGRTVRHGWKERGRKVGQTGLGFQWNECPATGSRPLEQTDEDGLFHVEQLREAAVLWQARVDHHRFGADSYEISVDRDANPNRPASCTWTAWAGSICEVVSERTEKRTRFYREVELVVRVYRAVRSCGEFYEQLRSQEQKIAEYNVDKLRAHEKMLLDAIKHHAATEPERKAEVSNGRAVHMQREGRVGRAACGSNAHYVHTTANAAEVTCSRCRKYLAGRVEAQS